MYKGADKSVRDNKGMTPADIAKENKFQNIERMLNETSSYFIDYYNVRPGFKKVERSRLQLFKFLFLYFLTTFIFVLIQYIIVDKRGLTEKILFGLA